MNFTRCHTLLIATAMLFSLKAEPILAENQEFGPIDQSFEYLLPKGKKKCKQGKRGKIGKTGATGAVGPTGAQGPASLNDLAFANATGSSRSVSGYTTLGFTDTLPKKYVTYEASNQRFTIGKTGTYLITYSMTCSNLSSSLKDATSQTPTIQVFKRDLGTGLPTAVNGTTGQITLFLSNPQSYIYQPLSKTTVVNLNENDTLELQVFFFETYSFNCDYTFTIQQIN
jgi:hypothetical protein